MRLVVKFRFGQNLARIITFIVYSMSMELILVLSLGIYKLYVFKTMMLGLAWHIIQLKYPPLSEKLFNYITLLGLMIAFPLIACLYVREYFN